MDCASMFAASRVSSAAVRAWCRVCDRGIAAHALEGLRARRRGRGLRAAFVFPQRPIQFALVLGCLLRTCVCVFPNGGAHLPSAFVAATGRRCGAGPRRR
eukprot:6538006-Alexandrium_andersonii.AAC.1